MKKSLIIFIVCSIAALSALIGCGEKGPPLPPEKIGEVISEPYDLKLSEKKGLIFLNWSHRIDPVDAFLKADSFDVFIASKEARDCEKCPFQFKLAGVVPMPQKEYITRGTRGLKYYFRIQAVNENGKRSKYSKTVQIEVK